MEYSTQRLRLLQQVVEVILYNLLLTTTRRVVVLVRNYYFYLALGAGGLLFIFSQILLITTTTNNTGQQHHHRLCSFQPNKQIFKNNKYTTTLFLSFFPNNMRTRRRTRRRRWWSFLRAHKDEEACCLSSRTSRRKATHPNWRYAKSMQHETREREIFHPGFKPRGFDWDVKPAPFPAGGRHLMFRYLAQRSYRSQQHRFCHQLPLKPIRQDLDLVRFTPTTTTTTKQFSLPNELAKQLRVPYQIYKPFRKTSTFNQTTKRVKLRKYNTNTNTNTLEEEEPYLTYNQRRNLRKKQRWNRACARVLAADDDPHFIPIPYYRLRNRHGFLTTEELLQQRRPQQHQTSNKRLVYKKYKRQRDK